MKRILLILVFTLIFSVYSYSAMIDGPANVFNAVKGKAVGQLNDGAFVKIIADYGFWVKIQVELYSDNSSYSNELKNNNSLRRLYHPIIGNVGYIGKGNNINITKIDNNYSTIELFTVKSNLKERIDYYTDYNKKFINSNRVEFKFQNKITEAEVNNRIKKFKNGMILDVENLPELEDKYVFIAVGYYKGKISVVQVFDKPTHANLMRLSIGDRFYINENGLIKSYSIGFVEMESADFKYYKNGFTKLKRNFDIHAPGMARMRFEAIGQTGNQYFNIDIIFNNGGVEKQFKPIAQKIILKLLQGATTIKSGEIDCSDIDDGIKKILASDFYQKIKNNSGDMNIEKILYELKKQ